MPTGNGTSMNVATTMKAASGSSTSPSATSSVELPGSTDTAPSASVTDHVPWVKVAVTAPVAAKAPVTA